MSIKMTSEKKCLKNKKKVCLYFWIGFGIILIIGTGYMLYKKFGRTFDLENNVVYVAPEGAGSTKYYYLQLEEDHTYVLMYEYVLGNDFAGQEDPPFIIYSYGTYEKKEETYDLTPERAVAVRFLEKGDVEKKKAYFRAYKEKGDMEGYWINNNIYQDKKEHYYLCAEKNGRRQKWLYPSKRTNLPATMEEFVSQYTYEEE